ncbi:MAG: hypothetical protein HQL95_10835 [Magnetococcales bacterium]|nr:hypothetical protein [Magnetococcales bacterium]
MKTVRNVKLVIIVLMTISMGFSFPLQVLWRNANLALTQYFFLLILYLIESNRLKIKKEWHQSSLLISMIYIYIILLIFNSVWQTAFGFVKISEIGSILVNFAFPLFYFYYFNKLASDAEIRALLMTMILIGLVHGAFFAYDSYSLLVLHEKTEYSDQAYMYSQMRVTEVSERASVGYRSQGMLESHAITSGWIALSCFASLALIPYSRTGLRILSILVFGTMLLAGLNYTAIFCFTIIILLIECNFYTIFAGDLSWRLIRYIAIVVTVVVFFPVVLGSVIDELFDESFYDTLLDLTETQLSFIAGEKEYSSSYTNTDTYFGGLLLGLLAFPINTIEYPLSLLFGDGFGSYGVIKGGDYGCVETLHRFGLPFYVAIQYGLFRMIYHAVRQCYVECRINPWSNPWLWFATASIFYILLTESHYSIWISKSILPIFFLSLALYNRHLNVPKLRWQTKKGFSS